MEKCGNKKLAAPGWTLMCVSMSAYRVKAMQWTLVTPYAQSLSQGLHSLFVALAVSHQ